MSSVLNVRNLLIGAVAAGVAVLYQPVNQRITTLGFHRPVDNVPIVHGDVNKVIPNTRHCEDVHYHEPSGLLFSACQNGDVGDRYSWFPPLGHFKDHNQAKGGGLVVIDPKTFEATPLKLKGFEQELVTHGIDVVSEAEGTESVYIYAVNHLPNPRHYLPNNHRNASEPKARSQIEIFTHKIGSDEAVHKRTIRSPMITTPNDILAKGRDGFYVTNDHFYREGMARFAEDLLTRSTAPWSNIVYVMITDRSTTEPDKGFMAFNVMSDLHNNNGLGRAGPENSRELLVTDAAGGVLYRLLRQKIEDGLKFVEEIQLPITIDNPSWYEDPYKTAGNDASGYVINGLVRAIDLGKYLEDPKLPAPVQVYHIRSNGSADAPKHAGWEQRLIYSDVGLQPRTASGAVIVPINPKENDGKKQGWLFVTGFLSENMIASKIDL